MNYGNVHVNRLYMSKYLPDIQLLLSFVKSVISFNKVIVLLIIHCNQGGLVSGETATGKTETIKDLARAVAKQVRFIKI